MVRASAAVASKALYISAESRGLDLASAECRRGCNSGGSVPLTSTGDTLLPRPRCFGDVDIVVTVVVAVGGLSLDARDMAAPDVAGSFRVSSRRFMRDLRSSSSSHTVEGAVVETVDSVPSAVRPVSGAGVSCMSVIRETSGEEL